MSYKLSAEESAAIDVELGLRKRHPGRPVLVVEDNPLNREITQLLLSKAGLKADAVDSGPAAVAQAACDFIAPLFEPARIEMFGDEPCGFRIAGVGDDESEDSHGDLLEMQRERI